jgi:hypothetical protein
MAMGMWTSLIARHVLHDISRMCGLNHAPMGAAIMSPTSSNACEPVLQIYHQLDCAHNMTNLPSVPMPRTLREVERLIAANVMAHRPQFEGCTAEEIADYNAEFAVQLMVREGEERRAREATAAQEKVGGGEVVSADTLPRLVHYEDGPGGVMRFSQAIMCF